MPGLELHLPGGTVITDEEGAPVKTVIHKRSKAARKVDKKLWPVVRQKLDMVNAAVKLDDLRVPPGNRLEELKGAQKGRHSIL